MKHSKLMVPGPVEVSHDVMQQMSSPQIPHYSEEAIGIYNSCLEKLKKIFRFRENGDVFIMPGSGSVALDAAIGTVVRRGDKVLVGVNGMFGERMKTIALSYGAEVVEVKVEEGKAITGKMLEGEATKNLDLKAILIVHLETSTGVLNPIKEIGEVAKKIDIPLIVDAVASIGVEEFFIDDWNVSFCGTCTQKGLETPPGLGIVGVGKGGWKFIKKGEQSDHGWYSNLLSWKEAPLVNKIRKGLSYPLWVTMPVNNVKSLHLSLSKIIDEEGIEKRIKRHSKMAFMVREGLENLGFELFPEKGYFANAVTVMRNNLGINVWELIEFLKQNYNIEISNGLGKLNNKIFRIGHIGQSASLDYVVPVLFGIEHYLREKGFNIPVGASLVGVK